MSIRIRVVTAIAVAVLVAVPPAYAGSAGVTFPQVRKLIYPDGKPATIPGLPQRYKVSINIVDHRYAQPSARDSIQLAHAPVTPEVVINPRPASSISGQVVFGSSGKPVAGITVAGSSPDFDGLAGPIKTDSNGCYTFWRLPSGRYTIAAVLDNSFSDWIAKSITIDLSADTKTANANLTLTHGASIAVSVINAPTPLPTVSITVFGPDGKPLPGADIVLTDANHFAYMYKADSNGNYSLTSSILKDGGAFSAHSSKLGAASPVQYTGQSAIDIHLTEGSLATFNGLVEDRHGKPIAGANITVSILGDNDPMDTFHTLTNDLGQYTVQSIIPNVRYTAEAEAPGFTSGYTERIQAEAGQTTQLPTIFLSAGDTFATGTVLDGQERPLKDVTITYDGIKNVTATTDADGHFTIQDLPEGYPFLHFSAQNGAKLNTFIKSGSGNTIIHMYAPTTGVVLGPDGKPIQGVRVTAFLKSNLTEFTYTDSSGQFTMASPGLVAGDTIWAISFTLGMAVPLTYSGEGPITLHLVSGVLSTVKGKVQNADGSPISNAQLTLNDLHGNSGDGVGNVVTDAQGQYSFPPCMASSRYQIFANAPGHANHATDEFAVGSAQTITVPPITLPIADATVGGTLFDATGNPAQNLSITDNDVTDLHATSDTAGHFVLNGVPRDKTWIEIQLKTGISIFRQITSGRGDNVVYLPKN